MTDGELGLSPLCLIVPGLGDSGPGHWQTIWERERHDCLRVQLGVWDDPNRNVWISRIDQAVGAAQGPAGGRRRYLTSHVTRTCVTSLAWTSTRFFGHRASPLFVTSRNRRGLRRNENRCPSRTCAVSTTRPAWSTRT